MPCLTRRCFLAIAAVACPLMAHAGLPETIVAVKPSVVLVGTYLATDAPRFRFAGTGFVVGDGLTVVTNALTVALDEVTLRVKSADHLDVARALRDEVDLILCWLIVNKGFCLLALTQMGSIST